MKRIRVAEPTLPPLDELVPYLEQIWERGVLTNAGPYHEQLETALRNHLDLRHISLFANGTLALVAALKLLRLEGEVITTPFSFVATAHAIRWAGLIPVFVDIDPETLNLDPDRIEAAITPHTSAILPVHCYGRPCEVERIGAIAKRHGLKVVYDAAHAFGVEHGGGSLLRYGDMSILSFHATKVFNTIEGGAVVCATQAEKEALDRFRNFGIGEADAPADFGFNGKMNEVCAAFGLVQLKSLPAALERRRAVDALYRGDLAGIRGLRCLAPTQNYAYFSILVGPDFALSRDALAHRLDEAGIGARKYFSPLLSECAAYRELASGRPDNLPRAHDAASRVLCLPMSSNLSRNDVARVVDCIRTAAD